VLALQEHRRTDKVDNEPGNGWHLKANPANPQGVGGVGFLLSSSANAALLDINFISDRIGHASFALSDRRLHFVCVYAPTAPATKANPAATHTFYDYLNQLLNTIPHRDFFFVAGDFNAPLLPDCRLVKNRCGRVNDNSAFLSTFIKSRNLMAANGCLRQHFRDLPTFFGTKGRVTRLDWIFCPLHHKAKIRKVANFRPACIPSDHSLITCDVNLRWQSFKRPPPFPLWAELRNPQVRSEFVHRVLSSIASKGTSAETFASAVADAAAQTLPKRKSGQPKAIWETDAHIAQARRRVQSAVDRTGQNSAETDSLRKELEHVYVNRTTKRVKEVVSEIQSATDNCRHRAAWQAINSLTGRKPRPNTVVGADSIADRKEKLVRHYSQVLNAAHPTSPLLPIPDFNGASSKIFDTGPISNAEVRRAAGSMRPDAAAGIDGIPSRVLRLPELLSTVTAILNQSSVLGGGPDAQAPDSWRISKIISIPKKGPSTNLDNQRGIALECTLVKLLNAVLKNRLLPGLNPVLLCIQSGFRPGRSTVEQVATVRSVVETCRTRNKAVSIVFVDFKKAFDSIARGAIPWLLEHYGVPPKLTEAVMDLYRETKAFVQTRDGETETFTTTSGVLQGDTLAPLLFIITIDYVLRRTLRENEGFAVAVRRSRRHPAVTLAALAFADDVALTCRDPAAAQDCLLRLCDEGARVGLHVNAKKTEALHIGYYDAPPLYLQGGEVIAECQDFRYLGSLIGYPDDILADRRAQAWRAAQLLRPIFESAAADKLKLSIFRAAVESILSYGLETVPMTATRTEQLDATFRELQRYALGIHYPDIISNDALTARCGSPPFSVLLRQRRLRLLGHVLRGHGRGESNPLAMVLLHPPSEGFRRGHAATKTLIETFHEDLAVLDMTPADTVRCPSQLYRERLCAGFR
jgi:hypothetical protein